MTKRKERNERSIKVGNIIYKHRLELSLEKNSRKYFLDDRVSKGLLKEDSISEKTLINIENGYNIPSLETLVYLAAALEIDFSILLIEIKEVMYS